MRALLPLTVLGVLLPVAATAGLVVGDRSEEHGSLTDHEFAVAFDIARTKADDEDASVRIAFARASDGTRRQSNTGSYCSSGRLLRIKLVGEFPRIVTTGPLGAPQDADSTVHAVVLTADAETEQVCLIGVQVGEVAPPRSDDTVLFED